MLFRLFFVILVFIFLSFAIPNIFFLINVTGKNLHYLHFAFALVLSIFIVYKNSFNLKEILIFLIIVSACILIGSITFDYSYDGRAYRQNAIYMLLNGWNPVYEDPIFKFKQFSSNFIWNIHYTKFGEIVSATLSIINLESGKARNLLLIIASFLYAFSIFRNLKIKTRMAFFITLFLSLNIISLLQVITFYVDGLIASFYLIVLLAILDLETNSSNHRLKYVILIISVVSLFSTKISTASFIAVAVVLYFAYKVLRKKYSDLLKIFYSGIISLFFIILFNVNPFITNLQSGKAMFYPILGKDSLDVILWNMPDSIKHLNYPERLLASIYSITYNNSRDPELKLKWPFTRDKSRGEGAVGYDTRLGGFGILFSGVLSISILILIYILFSKNYKKRDKLVLFSVVFGLFLATMNISSFWARFVSFITFIPFIIVLALVLKDKRTFPKLLVGIMFLAQSVEIIYAIRNVLLSNKSYTKEVITWINDAKKFNEKLKFYSAGDEMSFIVKLERYKIPYEIVDKAYFEANQSEFHKIPISINQEYSNMKNKE